MSTYAAILVLSICLNFIPVGILERREESAYTYSEILNQKHTPATFRIAGSIFFFINAASTGYTFARVV